MHKPIKAHNVGFLTEKWGEDAEGSVRDSVFNIDPGMSFKIHAALKRHPELGEELMNAFPLASAFHAYLQNNL